MTDETLELTEQTKIHILTIFFAMMECKEKWGDFYASN